MSLMKSEVIWFLYFPFVSLFKVNLSHLSLPEPDERNDSWKSPVMFTIDHQDLDDSFQEKIVSHYDMKGNFQNDSDVIDYPLNSTFYKAIQIAANSSSEVLISHIDNDYTDFLIVQAHSQIHTILLSYNRIAKEDELVNNTNAGLVIFLNQSGGSSSKSQRFFVHNAYDYMVSVLLLVRNYTFIEPIPGGYCMDNSSNCLPHPYLTVDQNLLTTWVSFTLASLHSSNKSYPVTDGFSDVVATESLKYEIYLTYMYEGDLHEEQYWQTVVRTSTVDNVKKYAKKVAEVTNWNVNPIKELFVSYSGVGAVVNVLVSSNGSTGSLYTSTVFYGCDFISQVKYSCTKLVSFLAKFFCASLLFMGILLLVFGHRWLNYTLFISGFLASWLLFFVIFVHVSDVNIEVLGSCTLIASMIGGMTWLYIWHKFQRPFVSALLIILLSSLFTAMISTHFLKYALVPSVGNMAAFIVFPVAFSALVVGYSVYDMKKVHVFSCCLLGSYAMVTPFAFYFGSSLTYIVINVVSLVTVQRFSLVVGYPPFQYCDIVLLCVWILLFLFGFAYQMYRERFGPPFYPPNLSFLEPFKTFTGFIKEKCSYFFCGSSTLTDDDSLLGDRPSLIYRVGCCCSYSGDRERLSELESFPQISSDSEQDAFKTRFARSVRNSVDVMRQTANRIRSKVMRSNETSNPNSTDVNDVEPLQN